ncbi:hypothetical protein CVS27_18785 [Arthrobacter glacialis]|uniref:Thiolase C-terminal domain-containing protein n=1 Tax=Arthrobacter glacialis TaxID=1664 RepID=A0A2S3ZS63_ARTGL|nr:hypothetical protein CVS27_18785 [Arthrobacter glacialis]
MSAGLSLRRRSSWALSATPADSMAPSVPAPVAMPTSARVGWNLADLGAFELNESFASQSLAVMRQLGLDNGIVNNDGGAIALGDPLEKQSPMAVEW